MPYDLDALKNAAKAESVSELARKLGVDRQQVYRWQKRGLDFDLADKLAIRLGFFPHEIWPTWFEDIRGHQA